MRYITDRKRAQGLGSGRSGTEHHWKMLVSSIIIFALAPIFIVTFAIGFGGSHGDVVAFFSRPFPAITSALMLVAGTLHFRAEVQEAIEDYVHGVKGKLLMVATNAFAYTLIVAGLFALVKLAL